MTDLEINKALALAIGWVEADMRPAPTHADPNSTWICTHEGHWRTFDYRDWGTIGPIAARYNRFPYKRHSGYWTLADIDECTTTPQLAIALAVIGGVK